MKARHNFHKAHQYSVQTGVCQGCLLSPTIFMMVVDWVMRQSTAGQRTGIQWTFTKQLEDLDFTDNIRLLSHKQQDAQEKLCWVAAEAEKTGLQINIGKTEAMRVNNKQHDPLRLHKENIKEVDKFVYPSSVVSKDGGTDEDIKCRINKARHAFNTLRPIWRPTAHTICISSFKLHKQDVGPQSVRPQFNALFGQQTEVGLLSAHCRQVDIGPTSAR